MEEDQQSSGWVDGLWLSESDLRLRRWTQQYPRYLRSDDRERLPA